MIIDRYRIDIEYREKKKRYEINCYKNDIEYKEKIKSVSKKKYECDE